MQFYSPLSLLCTVSLYELSQQKTQVLNISHKETDLTFKNAIIPN